MKSTYFINLNRIENNETSTITTHYFKTLEEVELAWKFYFPDRMVNEVELFIDGISQDFKIYEVEGEEE
jgi:hypothetical protein